MVSVLIIVVFLFIFVTSVVVVAASMNSSRISAGERRDQRENDIS